MQYRSFGDEWIENARARGKGGGLTGVLGHGAPVPGAMLLDVGDEDDVLLGRPWPLLDPLLVAARRPSHGYNSSLTH